MKKEVFTLSLVILFMLIPQIYGIVGVSPGIHEVDFEPYLEKQFQFKFFFDEGIPIEIYTSGDLAEYVKLDKNSLVGGGAVIATVKLPAHIETPGPHFITIGAREAPDKRGGIRISGNVLGIIKVKVPYPGKYTEIKLITQNVNTGEPINFQIHAENLGKETIIASAFIDVSDYNLSYIETLNLGTRVIQPRQIETYEKSFDTKKYKPGNYNVLAYLIYDEKRAETSGSFRIGELYIGIMNHTKEFEKQKINRFEILIESFWNDPINNVFVNVTILDYSISFLTPSLNIEAWKSYTLVGFFDTTPIKENIFKANITIHYGGRTTSKIVDLEIKKVINYKLYAFIITVLLLFLILMIIIVLFIRKLKKNGKKK